MESDNMAEKHGSVGYLIQADKRKNVAGALDFVDRIEMCLGERDETTMYNVPQQLMKLRFALGKMTPDDHLIIMGNPASIGLAFLVAAEVTGGRFNILKYDPQEARYWSSTVDMNQRI